jgi:hypothetical protein
VILAQGLAEDHHPRVAGGGQYVTAARNRRGFEGFPCRGAFREAPFGIRVRLLPGVARESPEFFTTEARRRRAEEVLGSRCQVPAKP